MSLIQEYLQLLHNHPFHYVCQEMGVGDWSIDITLHWVQSRLFNKWTHHCLLKGLSPPLQSHAFKSSHTLYLFYLCELHAITFGTLHALCEKYTHIVNTNV